MSAQNPSDEVKRFLQELPTGTVPPPSLTGDTPRRYVFPIKEHADGSREILLTAVGNILIPPGATALMNHVPSQPFAVVYVFRNVAEIVQWLVADQGTTIQVFAPPASLKTQQTPSVEPTADVPDTVVANVESGVNPSE